MGIEEKTPSELRSFIGPPLIESFANRYDMLQKDADMAVQFYREYFSVKGILENRVYDGITGMLSDLKNNGYILYVATSKPTEYSERILNHHQLDHYFAAVVGANMDHTRLAKSEIIKYIIDTYQVDPSESIMIGDRRFDIEGARTNNMRFMFVAYGHGDPDEMDGHDPDYVVSDCSEIPDIIKNPNIQSG
jgi:phosphoglycolate phosphatase